MLGKREAGPTGVEPEVEALREVRVGRARGAHGQLPGRRDLVDQREPQLKAMKVALALGLGQRGPRAVGFDALPACFVAQRRRQDGIAQEERRQGEARVDLLVVLQLSAL